MATFRYVTRSHVKEIGKKDRVYVTLHIPFHYTLPLVSIDFIILWIFISTKEDQL